MAKERPSCKAKCNLCFRQKSVFEQTWISKLLGATNLYDMSIHKV